MSTTPTTIDHPPLTRLEERIRDASEFPEPAIVITFPFENDDRLEEYGGDSFGLAGWDERPSDDQPSYEDRLFWSTRDVPAPDPADLCERIPFLPEPDFATWIFAVANEILDHPSPRCRWLAQRITDLAHRAEFFGAASPEEFDAREAVQEAWAAEGGRS